MDDRVGLAGLEKLAKAATPGPWERMDMYPFRIVGDAYRLGGAETRYLTAVATVENNETSGAISSANTAYIVAASPDLALRMCAALREMHEDHREYGLVRGILARHGLELE